jgi:LPS O-antigen subunit length determinant protein (WzzB/FepE family)
MAKNLHPPQFQYQEDEVNLIEIIKTLIEYKILIILTVLIFTIASIIYSLSLKPEFKSSTLIEIGYFKMPDGTQKIIQTPSSLIEDLKIDLIYKNLDNNLLENLIIEPLENKLIRFELTSNFTETNENLLTEVANYIDTRHSKLAALINDQKKDQISNEINLIESEISFIKAIKLSNIEGKLDEHRNELPIIDLELSQLEKIVIDDTNNLSLLKRNDMHTERAASSPTLEQIIFSYKSKINELQRQKSFIALEVKKLNNQLKNLENTNLQSDEIFRLSEKQKTLEKQLQELNNRVIIKSLPVGKIKTNIVKSKIKLIVALGIIIGFFASFLLVFINNFIKNSSKREV